MRKYKWVTSRRVKEVPVDDVEEALADGGAARPPLGPGLRHELLEGLLQLLVLVL